VGLVSAGLALGLAGCDLAALADKLADDFERGIQERAAEAVRNAQAKIGQDGGDVATHDGAVAVPAGAVQSEVQVAVAQVDPAMLSAPLSSALDPVTPPVAFTPHGTEFAEAVTLSLFFEKTVGTSNLHVVRLDNEQDTSWERVDPETVQFDSGLALVSTTHFSVYGVVSCDTGKYADLCRAFDNGDATVADLAKEAPPKDDAWGGVYKPPTSDGGTDGPGTDPGEMDAQCRTWLDQCRPVFETCSQDPAADICSRVPECLDYAEQCGIKIPDDGVDGDPCAPIGDACKAGDRAACDAYDQCLNTIPEPSDDCLKLASDCQRGNKDACTRFMQQCHMPPPPPPPRTCEQLNTACKAGDQTACATAVKQCGATTLDCADLATKCKAGDLNACHAHDLNCNDEPQPDDCETLAKACAADDQLSCDLFSEQCGQSFPSQEQCDEAFLACNDDILDACTFWNDECSAHYPPPPPPDAECMTSHDACFGSGVSDVEACDAFFGSCRISAEDCASLDSACMADNTNACDARDAYCAGQPPPPPDGDPMCADAPVTWEICKTPDNCGSASSCAGEQPPVPTDLQTAPGDFVHCDSIVVCPEGEPYCFQDWNCVLSDAPPPDAAP
jgi:hypothetical protein